MALASALAWGWQYQYCWFIVLGVSYNEYITRNDFILL
jgi:hypothetical protein